MDVIIMDGWSFTADENQYILIHTYMKPKVAFKTIDDLWAVLNYTKPWELELVLC